MNKSWWWLAGFIIVGILLGAGVLFLITRPQRGEPIRLLPAPTQSPIMVYVSGEVIKEGLYTLPAGSRVNDAIQEAGGFTENANTGALNLAKILVDGEQIEVATVSQPEATQNGSDIFTISSTLVNINTASLEELDTLPEIGPKTAQNIIDFRNSHGHFATIEDILDVPEIGPGTFDKIKDLITVGTSP